MGVRSYLLVSASLLLAAAATPSLAQTPNAPWVQMETTGASLGLGGQSGEGLLHLPNLGTNCTYPFKVQGFGGGLQVGVSKAVATGYVQNMRRVADLAGNYSATEGQATIIAGAGTTSMKNKANPVVINLKSETQGLALGFGGQGMAIQVNDPQPRAQGAYILEFGFNKTWVSQQSRALLDVVASNWKCRFVNIWLFGHSDTVGKEDENLELASKRAAAARDYLIGLGLNPDRVFIKARGEDSQLAPTEDNVRLRINRAVVVVVQQMS